LCAFAVSDDGADTLYSAPTSPPLLKFFGSALIMDDHAMFVSGHLSLALQIDATVLPVYAMHLVMHVILTDAKVVART